MDNNLKSTDYVNLQTADNKPLTAQAFFEAVTNIGMGRTFTVVSSEGGGIDQFQFQTEKTRNGWLVALHVTALVVFSVLSLIALVVREGLRATHFKGMEILPQLPARDSEDFSDSDDGSDGGSSPVVHTPTDVTGGDASGRGQAPTPPASPETNDDSALQYEVRLTSDGRYVPVDSESTPSSPLSPHGGTVGTATATTQVFVESQLKIKAAFAAAGVERASHSRNIEAFILHRLETQDSWESINRDHPPPTFAQITAEYAAGRDGQALLPVEHVKVLRRKAQEDDRRLICEVIPRMYLGGQYRQAIGGAIPYDYDEKSRSTDGQVAVKPVPRFGAVLAVAELRRGRQWPATTYMKDGGAYHHFVGNDTPRTDIEVEANHFGGVLKSQEKYAMTITPEQFGANRRAGIQRIWAGVRFLEREHAAGHDIYVHCTQGCDRSVTIFAAFLMYKTDLTQRQIMDFINIQRRNANTFDDSEDNRLYLAWYMETIEEAVSSMKTTDLESQTDKHNARKLWEDLQFPTPAELHRRQREEDEVKGLQPKAYSS